MDGESAYRAAVAYLDRAAPRGSAKHKRDYAFAHGIERTAHLLDLLNGGACRDRSIVVAGSKGKGSTTVMASAILTATGRRVGTFTGPHLHDCRERFQIDGRMISRDRLTAYVQEVERLVESAWGRPAIGTPTTFEMETAIALRYFDDEGVDLVVLEVGVGGRHDAVNVAEPRVSAITNISLEHTAMLGDTLAEIAYAKAGIVRRGGVAISAPQSAEAMAVVEAVCGELEAHLVRVGVDWRFASLESRLDEGRVGQRFEVTGPGERALARDLAGRALFLPLLGAHQAENAAVAIAAVDALSEVGVSAAHVEAGLARVRWPGRLEILSRDPLVVVDGAHTPYSMQRLAEALRSVFRYGRLIVILGISADKDIPRMVEAIGPLADVLIVTQFNHPRSVAARDLAGLVPAGLHTPRVAAGIEEAVSCASGLAGPADLICVTGSLYLVGKARELLLPEV